MDRISIAIDGPAGAGKSTIAKMISKCLGIVYLDTGAMYRTVALKAIQSGVDTKDQVALSEMVKDIDVFIEYKNNEQAIYLDKENVTGLIRTPRISVGASDVAVVPAVRIKMVELQREIASKNSVVMDGRDIGTYVLPNADFKFFLTASVEERARRRFNEMTEKGDFSASFEDVLKDIRYRDHNDSSRAFAPLAKADDAIEIDSTQLQAEQVAETIMIMIKKKGSKE